MRPRTEKAGIGMGREHVEMRHLRIDRHPGAVDLQFPRPVLKRAPPRARGLEAGEQDRVARVGREGFQVMQHAPARRHARGGDDDLGEAAGADRLRRLDVSGAAGDGEDVPAGLRVEAVVRQRMPSTRLTTGAANSTPFRLVARKTPSGKPKAVPSSAATPTM